MLMQLENNRNDCRSPIEDYITLPVAPQLDELEIASGDNTHEDAVIFFRKLLGDYILNNAPFFTDVIVVPVVRELRTALQHAQRCRMEDYMRGAETDRGYCRSILENYIKITKAVNLGCRKAKRSTTLTRLYKLLTPADRQRLKALQLSHVEVEIGLNNAPRDGFPEEVLEDYIAQRRLCGSGIENILRNQMSHSRDTSSRATNLFPL